LVPSLYLVLLICYLFVSSLEKLAFYALRTYPTTSLLSITNSRPASFFFIMSSCLPL
jgi:hypothetical protein